MSETASIVARLRAEAQELRRAVSEHPDGGLRCRISADLASMAAVTIELQETEIALRDADVAKAVKALRQAQNFIEDIESEMGDTLWCGDAVRAALARIEAPEGRAET